MQGACERSRVSLLVAGVVGAATAAVTGIFMWRTAQPWTLVLDTGSVFLGQTVPAFRSWMRGRIPEWSDLLWGGFPLLGDCTTAALYPPHLIAYAASLTAPLRFFDVAFALHLGLFAAGSAALLRTMGAGAVVSAFAGILAALCPFAHYCGIAFFPVLGAQAWWPWVFTSAELLARPGTPLVGAAMVLGWIALAAQVLVGVPEQAFYCACAASAWLLTRRSGLAFGHRVVRLAMLGVGSAALAAPQLLPTAAFVPLSQRSSGPGSLAQLASFFLRTPERLLIPGTGQIHVPAFLGVAPLGLAFIAVWMRRPRAVFLVVLAALTLGLATGPQLGLYGWLHRVPPFDQFRSPMKLYAFTEFAIVWAAALGAQALWCRPGRSLRLVAAAFMVAAIAERVAYLPVEVRGFVELRAKDGLRPEVLDELARSIPLATRAPGQPSPFVYDMAGVGGGEYARSLGALVGLSSVRAGGVALISLPHVQLLGTKRPSTMLGVQYALVPPADCQRVEDRLGWTRVQDSPNFCVLRNPGSPLHYTFARRVTLVDSMAEMVRLVRARRDGPVPIVATEGNAGLATGGAIIRSYEAGRAVLTSMSSSGGFLLVRDSFLPGWTAWVDGRVTTLYPAAGLYFALAIDPGTHTVELRYRAPGFRAGVLVAAVWTIAVVAWTIAARRRRYASP